MDFKSPPVYGLFASVAVSTSCHASFKARSILRNVLPNMARQSNTPGPTSVPVVLTVQWMNQAAGADLAAFAKNAELFFENCCLEWPHAANSVRN